jgi:hypothetical protein
MLIQLNLNNSLIQTEKNKLEEINQIIKEYD